MIDLNKSQLQEMLLSSGMELLLHQLQGYHLIPILFLLSSQCFQGCFPHYPLTPHLAFCPFWDAFPPEALPRG